MAHRDLLGDGDLDPAQRTLHRTELAPARWLGMGEADSRSGRLTRQGKSEATGVGAGRDQPERGGGGGPAGGASGGLQARRLRKRGRGRGHTPAPSPPLSGRWLPLPLARAPPGPGTRAPCPGPKQNPSARCWDPALPGNKKSHAYWPRVTAGYPPGKARCHWSAHRGSLAFSGYLSVFAGSTRRHAADSTCVFSEDELAALLPGGEKGSDQKRTLEKTHLQNKGPHCEAGRTTQHSLCITKHPQGSAHSRLGKSSNAGQNRLEDAGIDPATLAC